MKTYILYSFYLFNIDPNNINKILIHYKNLYLKLLLITIIVATVFINFGGINLINIKYRLYISSLSIMLNNLMSKICEKLVLKIDKPITIEDVYNRVNENSNDTLNRIEDTNTKIEDTNTKIDDIKTDIRVNIDSLEKHVNKIDSLISINIQYKQKNKELKKKNKNLESKITFLYKKIKELESNKQQLSYHPKKNKSH